MTQSASGVLIVDKPQGPTSSDVVLAARKALANDRIGHTGTLDPMATGVLVLCIGEATKLQSFLTVTDKVYAAQARLGVETDTLDAEGKVVATKDASHVTAEEVARALSALVGTIEQKPPAFSAIRVGGKRLHELARAGQEASAPARPVEVYAIELEGFEAGVVRFSVHCGKGTYIRSLAASLGESLGVGAHLIALRRLRVGRFSIEDALPLETLSSATKLVSLANALADLPAVRLKAEELPGVRDGNMNSINRLQSDAEGLTRLLGPDEQLVAVAESQAGRLRLMRVFR